MIDLTSSKEMLADLEAGRDLRYKYLWEPDDLLLNDFYPGYDQSFVICSEKEELQGFRECLALNVGETYKLLSAQYGPYREYVLVTYDSQGTAVGGANFICFLIDDAISINLNYVFILPVHRGKGYFRPILKACSHLALTTLRPFLSSSPPFTDPIVFFEQNDPVRMSVKDYEEDSQQSGLDQIKRIAIWAKVGARIIDTPYVQPALSADQKDDFNLLFCVISDEIGPTLAPCLLKAHIERFFRISVLKHKADISTNHAADRYMTTLEGQCNRGESIRLVSGREWASRSLNLGKKIVGVATGLRELVFTR